MVVFAFSSPPSSPRTLTSLRKSLSSPLVRPPPFPDHHERPTTTTTSTSTSDKDDKQSNNNVDSYVDGGNSNDAKIGSFLVRGPDAAELVLLKEPTQKMATTTMTTGAMTKSPSTPKAASATKLKSYGRGGFG